MAAADVVIGANFGDEGKGLITDFLAAPHGTDAVVVRFNGGAQAGHTVTAQDGRRHVFSHFSSGSFAGAETFLSRFFVCNPLLFAKEHALLESKSAVPVVHVDAASPVTTPFDMMINQIAEGARGDKRHGSCGVGFGETLERGEKSPYVISYGDLGDKSAVKSILRKIRADWVPRRLAALKINALSPEWQARLQSDGIIDKFLDDTAFFLQHSRKSVSFAGKKIVFEGAQGLLLDAERGWFPHVTRSRTGIKNVLALAKDIAIDRLRVTYITRAYATRHGAGPLPHEMMQAPHAKIKDDTNVRNDWQGHLRFAWLDADLLEKSVHHDLSDAFGVLLDYGLAVTCLDQIGEAVSFVTDGQVQNVPANDLPSVLKKKTGAGFLYGSRGPSRADVGLL